MIINGGFHDGQSSRTFIRLLKAGRAVMASKANCVVGFHRFHVQIQETCVDVEILSGELEARHLGWYWWICISPEIALIALCSSTGTLISWADRCAERPLPDVLSQGRNCFPKTGCVKKPSPAMCGSIGTQFLIHSSLKLPAERPETEGSKGRADEERKSCMWSCDTGRQQLPASQKLVDGKIVKKPMETLYLRKTMNHHRFQIYPQNSPLTAATTWTQGLWRTSVPGGGAHGKFSWQTWHFAHWRPGSELTAP